MNETDDKLALEKRLRTNGLGRFVDAVSAAFRGELDTIVLTLDDFSAEPELATAALRYAVLSGVTVTIPPVAPPRRRGRPPLADGRSGHLRRASA